ncbi:MAG: DUF3078 domain-containing protein [Bacteroidales bacterium]|nr:DUF3078 domain-containing protein [Bacteroidales bacterium]
MNRILSTLLGILVCFMAFGQNTTDKPVETKPVEEKTSEEKPPKEEKPKEEAKPWWLEGSINLSVNFDVKLNAEKFENFTNIATNTDLTLHHRKGNWRWDTQLIAQLKYKYDEDLKAYKWRKKNDYLELTSSVAYNFINRFFVTGDIRFTTYIAPKCFYTGSGEDVKMYRVGGFLSPAYIDIRPGLQWRPLATKENYIELGVTPIGGRLLICTIRDSLAREGCLGDYFAANGGDVNFMFGGYVDFKYTWERKRFSGRVQTSFFFPYRKYGPAWDFDMTLDLRLSFKFAKVFSLNFMLQSGYVNAAYRSTVITDKKIKQNAEFRDRIDFSEQLALGIGWTF